ncbi:MAG: CPBP family intramembrane metalloprotease [Myxococcales bacterium]|nr:CPBP family intramembrane metalloprotease [Myxococcales bacterium]
MRRAVLAIGALACVVGLVGTLADVGRLGGEEQDYRGPLLTVGELGEPSASVGRLRLVRGQSVSFSLCSTDAFVSGAWKAASFAIYHHDPTELVLRVRLDDDRLATLRQGPGGGCVDLARADGLSGEGEFSVVVEGPPREPQQAEGSDGAAPAAAPRAAVSALAPADTQVWAHVTALRPLTKSEMGPPLLAWVGVLLLTLGWLLRAPAPSAFEQLAAAEEPDVEPAPEDAPPGDASAARTLALALTGLLIAFGVSAALPPGPLTPMGAALVLFVGQLLLAFGLARGAPALGLAAPARWPLLLAAMPFLGVALRLGLAPLSRLVPSTGVAPIEHLVSAPSGLLTMLAIGLVAPFAEELFFRGLLFRQVERLRGPGWATAVSAVLFALVHAPQAFGAWPSFVSVACAGAAFSLLRWRTGSTLSGILAHLGYNGAIALPVLVSILTR